MQEHGRFNTDILQAQGDAEVARAAYPLVADLLVWPEMLKAFGPVDDEAGARKRRSHRRGLQGLALGLASLCLAVLDPYLHDAPAWLTTWPVVPALGVVLLAGALLLGSRVLRGADRDAWLLHRLCTERLRQLHFQWLVRRATQIASTAPGQRGALLAERDVALKVLMQRLESDGAAAVHAVLKDEASAGWSQVAPVAAAATPDPATLDQLAQAYRELRFGKQAAYAGSMLEEGHGLWPRSPLGKARRMGEAANTLTVVAVLVAIVVLVVGVWRPAGHGPINAVAGAIALLAAMCVLALRVLDEGLRPRAEVARYRAYEAGIEERRRQFDGAPSVAQRIDAMLSMEALAYGEMRQFVLEHSEASFSF